MLQKPKHFPVYTASYLDKEKGKIGNISIIAKIDNKNINSFCGNWGEVEIISINIFDLNVETINKVKQFSQSRNTYENDDSIFVPKDTWIKYAKKANKLIDEANKQGANIKRISY